MYLEYYVNIYHLHFICDIRSTILKRKVLKFEYLFIECLVRDLGRLTAKYKYCRIGIWSVKQGIVTKVIKEIEIIRKYLNENI